MAILEASTPKTTKEANMRAADERLERILSEVRA
jgi:hypothetical protein